MPGRSPTEPPDQGAAHQQHQCDRHVKRCDHVNCVQMVQEQIGAARICVVRDRGYTEQDEQELLHQFRLKMGNELDLEIEYLDEPIKTQSGKTLSIISKLKHG